MIAGIIIVVIALVVLFLRAIRRPVRRTRAEVINLMERVLENGGDELWDDFVYVRIADPELESVRQRCEAANLSPKVEFDKTLQALISELSQQ